MAQPPRYFLEMWIAHGLWCWVVIDRQTGAWPGRGEHRDSGRAWMDAQAVLKRLHPPECAVCNDTGYFTSAMDTDVKCSHGRAK